MQAVPVLNQLCIDQSFPENTKWLTNKGFRVASSRQYSCGIPGSQYLEGPGSLEPSTAHHQPNQVACTCEVSVERAIVKEKKSFSLFQICNAKPSIPIISNVPSVHDFPEKISQIFPRDFCISFQVVVQNGDADVQIAFNQNS